MKLANMNAGKSINILMLNKGINGKSLSASLELSEVTISGMRNSKGITARNLVKVCEYFEVTASQFFKFGEE
jgi:DNA-binding Xre family transcriptional regulator